MKGFERELEASGFSGYLTKPIDVDTLLGDLAQRLGGRALEADAPSAPASSSPANWADPPAAENAPIVSHLLSQPGLGHIVARFVSQLPAKLTEMDAAAERGDMSALSALAHWLKGAGGSMGFDELFDPAKALEDAAEAGDSGAATSVLSQLHGLERRILLGAKQTQNELTEAET